MKSVGRPILAAIRSGSYATQAATKSAGGDSKPSAQDAKVTKLPNGVVVASVENHSPLSRVAILYNAGARHESADNLGLTHCIRAASNCATKRMTAFLIAKEMQQMGGNLSCSTYREHVEYTAECLRSDLAAGFGLLNHVATTPVFKSWEVDDLSKKLKLDIELYHQSPEARLIEALHKAAYRDTLGQSLYMCEQKVGSFSTKSLEAFVHAHYVPQGATVAAVGVDHEALLHQARKLHFSKQGAAAAPATKKAKYYGGESRVQMKGPLVHAALVTEGVAWNSADLLSMSLLQLILGVGPFVKYGSGVASSKVGKAALSASGNPSVATCINLHYSDSGLFGFQVVAGKKDVRKVLTAVVGAMGQATKGNIADPDLQRAKKQFKNLLAINHESAESVLHSIGTQAVLAGKIFPPSDVEASVDKITAEDISKVAKKIINGKPTFAAAGDLVDTPYLDEIFARA